MLNLIRRTAVLGAAALTFSALLSATPALATSETATSAPAVYIDLKAPAKSFTATGNDVPVGAWTDRGFHASKAYFTFDLRPYRGATIGYAEAYATETAANDCTKPRATELWVTDPATAPTWLRQPKERTKLPGPGAQGGCLWNRVEWDAGQAITAALAAGKESVTFALRMPDDRQFDPAYGRRVENRLHLYVDYNRPPTVPTDLHVGLKPCGADPVYTADNPIEVYGRVDDPDRSAVSAKVTVWAADDPAKRLELGPDYFSAAPRHVRYWLPSEFTTHGREYRWTMQGVEEGLAGPVSAPCSFIIDRVAPTTAPVVTSADYPNDRERHGAIGIPGTFTIDAKGDQDIIGFNTGNGYVPADRPGGVATVQYTPKTEFDTFSAWGRDKAGNNGPGTHYGFTATPSEPGVTYDARTVAVGKPLRLDFTPGAMPGVVEYVYDFGWAGEVVVPAGPDGKATTTVTPKEPWNYLVVSSRTKEGWRSEQWEGRVEQSGVPTVTSATYPADQPGGGVGVPGEFVFSSGRPDVTDFFYMLDNGESGMVPATNGTATVSLTPGSAGGHVLEVSSVYTDGNFSDPRYYSFIVNG
ncbi:hypothetical protein LCL61_16910 [Amycolatopsis coloradensis]|uniref:Uncharacterized protein n=1 Tax=Amycolatopsis coloradensis TaxID=76021 RepID=A0ACD5BD30_9PSEU